MSLSFGIFCYLTVRAKPLQSLPTLQDSKDYSPTDSPAHGDSPGENTGVSFYALLQGIFPTQGSNSYISCTGRFVLYCSHHLGIKLT